MKVQSRLLKPHNKECFGVKRDHPWCLLGTEFRGRGGQYSANKNGVGHGYHSWIKAVCLDTQCPAEIAFKEDDVFRAIL